MRWGMRTVLLVYLLELVYLVLLFADHSSDLRHMRAVVLDMVRDLR